MKTAIKAQFGSFRLIFLGLIGLCGISASAQELPPIPIEVEVRTARFLNFGAFTTGENGGSISVGWEGNVTTTGDVFRMHLGDAPSSALFDVYANPGTIITVQTPPQIILRNSNDDGTMVLVIEDQHLSTGRTFISTMNQMHSNEVFVGGTLHVGNSQVSTPGRYYGNFTLTFIHQ